MALILIELNSTKKNFFINIDSITTKISRDIQTEQPLYIDTLYTTVVNSILTGMLDDVKNKRITKELIDNTSYINVVTDNLMYSFYDSLGYNMTMEEAYSFASSIESGILEDVIRFIPEIDNENTEILSFHFLPTNSVAIEYREYENSIRHE